MKKRLAAISSALILLIAALFCASCKLRVDYLSYVSELRSDVFCGESENYSVTVYSGLKEKPFKHDGIVEKQTLFLSIKIFMKERSDEVINVKFEIDGTLYEKQTQYDPVSSTISCSAEVKALPQNELILTFCRGDEIETIKTTSLLKADTLSFSVALQKATEKAADFLNEHTSGSKFEGEISIRLLCESGRNYYYVGFILQDGLKLAYLLDGTTGEILAEKKL